MHQRSISEIVIGFFMTAFVQEYNIVDGFSNGPIGIRNKISRQQAG
jgi:hypothetical protein